MVDMKNATQTTGDVARDPRDGGGLVCLASQRNCCPDRSKWSHYPRDGEVAMVLGSPVGRLYPVMIWDPGRGGPSGPSALAGEITHRALNDPKYPFERLDPLTGHEAIDYAKRHGLLLAKATDPTEEARSGLTPDEARRIAAEDPSLITLEVAS